MNFTQEETDEVPEKSDEDILVFIRYKLGKMIHTIDF